MRDVLKVAIPALSESSDKTRTLAIELVVEAYRVSREDLYAHLTSVKPVMMKQLEQKFRALDMASSKVTTVEGSTAVTQEGESVLTEENELNIPIPSFYSDESPEFQQLVNQAKAEAQDMVGPVTWRKLQSSTWNNRRQGLAKVLEALGLEIKAKSEMNQRSFAVYCVLMSESFQDAVSPIVNEALSGTF